MGVTSLTDTPRVPAAAEANSTGHDADRERVYRAMDAEYRDLAHSIHDTAAQTVTAVGLALARANLLLGDQLPPDARAAMQEALLLAGQAAREVRQLSYRLYPPSLERLGLASAIRGLCDDYRRRTGQPLDVEIPSVCPAVPALYALTLYRVVQLACVEGPPRLGGVPTRVALLSDPSHVVLVVTVDAGHGPVGDIPASLRDRFDACGGVLSVGVQPTSIEWRAAFRLSEGLS